MKLSELVRPTPKQQQFLDAIEKYTYVLYGGAKYGGKSYILRWALVKLLMQWARQGINNVRVGLFCEDYPTLKDRQITKIKVEFPRWLGELSDNLIEGMSFRLHDEFGGGVIALRNLDDPSKYASSEFAAVGIDELTKNQREVFDQMRSIIRWPGIERTKFLAATNPGEIGHAWVKKLWIDRDFSEDDPRPEEVHFVQSLPTDNPHAAKAYLRELESLPEPLKQAYWFGNWDIHEGMFFSEWRMQNADGTGYHVCQPFEVPDYWKRFIAIDWGYFPGKLVALWFTVAPTRRLYLYRELVLQENTAKLAAQKIVEASGNDKIAYIVADPSMWAKDRGESVPSIAEEMISGGIPNQLLRKANNDRINGWLLVRKYLSPAPDGLPWLQVFATCRYLITSLPNLIHDEIKPEDLDTDGDDHGADALRYGCMTRPFRKQSGVVGNQSAILEELKRKSYVVQPDGTTENMFAEAIKADLKREHQENYDDLVP